MEPNAKKRKGIYVGEREAKDRCDKTEAQFASVTFLKRIVEAIKDLITDANFEFTSEGVRLQAMDSAHVSLVHAVISRADCIYYTCEREITLGMKLENLHKILTCGRNDDLLTLCHVSNPKNNDQVKFSFESQGK